MKTFRTLTLAAALALGVCGAASASSAPPPTVSSNSQGDIEALFPLPATPLQCAPSESSLADLLEALSESTGVLYLAADPRVAAALREPRALSLATNPIAAVDAYFEVESQLAAHEFFLTCNRDVTPVTVGVHLRRFSAPSAPAHLEVRRDELHFIRRHPALLFATSIEVEHLELRTLPTRLGPLLAQSHLSRVAIAPIGFSRTVALLGEGRFVAEAVDVLRRLDAESAASARGSLAEAPPSVLDLAFPAPTGALHVPAGASSLADLMTSLSSATGVAHTVDANSKAAFEAAQLSMPKSITLQPAEAYAWIESQLLERGLGLSCDMESRPATVQVRGVTAFSADDAACLAVGLGDLAFVRRHPALRFTTTLKLENVDARVAPSTLRPVLPSDPREGALTPLADAQSITLRGHGRFVAQTVDLLRRCDAEAARSVTGPGPDGPALKRGEASKR